MMEGIHVRPSIQVSPCADDTTLLCGNDVELLAPPDSCQCAAALLHMAMVHHNDGMW